LFYEADGIHEGARATYLPSVVFFLLRVTIDIFGAAWGCVVPTFRWLPFAKGNTGLGQIVGREFYGHFITGDNANEILAHFTRDMSQHIGAIGKFHAKHRSGQNVDNSAFGLDSLFFRHE